MKTVRFLEDEAIARGAMQKPDELGPLVDLIKSRPEPKTLMEIGTCAGGTLWLWCRLCALDALLISLDLPAGSFSAGIRYDPVRISHYPNPDQRLKLLQGDSHSPKALEAVEKILKDRQLDILMIDGDHTLEGVTQDWEMYSPLVKSGGLIIFHDIVDHSETFPLCQVKPLWDELKESYEHYEFIGEGDPWGGIGVLVYQPSVVRAENRFRQAGGHAQEGCECAPPEAA